VDGVVLDAAKGGAAHRSGPDADLQRHQGGRSEEEKTEE
jgi:hypothetical protein